jgi:C-terminal processing protease CtpA/Prc
VTFDYARQRVFFVPNALHGSPFAADRAGLWINRRGDEVIVKAVMADGPAEAAGLRAGDAIVDIDGTPAAAIMLDALRRRLRELPVGTVLALRVKRADEVFDAALRLRELIPASMRRVAT